MKPWRLIDTGPLPGPLNMGIDMAILQLNENGQAPPTLRFYEWSPAAVSLGYFQKPTAVNVSKCHQLGIDVVRRSTGGRAVLHLNDLTYSIVAGTKDGMPFSVTAAYHLLSEGLLAGFRKLGFEPETGHEPVGVSEADICFMRFAAGDLLCKGKKFMGSAQTWTGSSLLQHGSIIFESQIETLAAIFSSTGDSSEDLCEKINSRTTSLNDILGRKVDPAEVKACLIEGMTHALGVEFQVGELSPEEWEMVRFIVMNQIITLRSEVRNVQCIHPVPNTVFKV